MDLIIERLVAVFGRLHERKPGNRRYSQGRVCGGQSRGCDAHLFFDYIVNSAYQTKNYEGITPGEEKVLLVVNMTVRNTDQSECEIYDIDFQAQWGDDGDDDFAYPLTADDQEPVGAMAEAEYTLQPSEEKTADLVFEIPQGKENFSVAYREEFADGTSGDTFFTYFNAPTK